MSYSFVFHPTIIIRTPTSPFATEISESSIREHLSDPHFAEALYIASHTLYQQSQKWLHGKITNAKEANKVLLSIAKYLNRKRSRCTPFGLFATTSTLRWGETSRIILGKEERLTRFSMSFLETLAYSLASSPSIQPHLYYYPNSSIYTIGNEIRYVEYNSQKGKRTYQISAVAESKEVIAVIANCHNGLSYTEVINKLIDQKVTKNDATLFVNELIQTQLLVSELEPTVTGEDFMHRIKQILQRNYDKHPSEPIRSLIELLGTLETQLQTLDQDEHPNLPIYEAITKQVTRLAALSSNTGDLFQVNAFRTTIDSTLDHQWQQEIERALDILAYLVPPTKNPSLEEFKQQFYNRYEEAEMPLLPVLDTETGIGYGSTGKGSNSSLIEGLTLTNSSELLSNPLNEVTEQWLRRKLVTSQQQGYATIKIRKEDINHLSGEEYILPTSTSVIFQHIDEKTIYLEGVSGASATSILGRFANDNEDIHQLARDIADTEQAYNPNVILAEIVHLPEQRIGNILRRPLLRDYEMPYLAQSPLPNTQQIALQDIDVSVRKGRIVLRSRRLNKEIMPKLSTAHNYAYKSLPVYQFLCNIQTQGTTNRLSLLWHPAYHSTKRLPRIVYGRVVLGLATWYLSKDDFLSLCKASSDNLPHCFEQFKRDWHLPDYFVLVHGDRELLVDTNQWLTVKAWVDSIRKQDYILLKEFLYRPEQDIVTDELAHSYTSQFIASLIRTEAAYSPVPVSKDIQISSVQRVFMLGSEWLYYKFYCGTHSSDKLLLESIGPLAEALLNDQQIDQWFFIRYSDPDNHLRVRFHLSNIAQLNAVIATINTYVQNYEVSGHIWKSHTGTYRREIERYGTSSMELSEQLFFADSTMVLRMLAQTTEDDTGNQRWLKGISAINALLDKFGYSLTDKYQLMRTAGSKFHKEFGIDKTLKRNIDVKYRDHREAIIETIQKKNESTREGNMDNTIRAILSLTQQSKLTVALDDLVGSFIHMHVNRLIASNPRLHELVMYDFLSRYYRSVIAQSEKNSS